MESYLIWISKFSLNTINRFGSQLGCLLSRHTTTPSLYYICYLFFCYYNTKSDQLEFINQPNCVSSALSRSKYCLEQHSAQCAVRGQKCRCLRLISRRSYCVWLCNKCIFCLDRTDWHVDTAGRWKGRGWRPLPRKTASIGNSIVIKLIYRWAPLVAVGLSKWVITYGSGFRMYCMYMYTLGLCKVSISHSPGGRQYRMSGSWINVRWNLVI